MVAMRPLSEAEVEALGAMQDGDERLDFLLSGSARRAPLPTASPRDPRTILARSPHDLRTIPARSTHDLPSIPARSPHDLRTISPRSSRDPRTIFPRSPRDPRTISPRSPLDPRTIPARSPRDLPAIFPRSFRDPRAISHATPTHRTTSPRPPLRAGAGRPSPTHLITYAPTYQVAPHLRLDDGAQGPAARGGRAEHRARAAGRSAGLERWAEESVGWVALEPVCRYGRGVNRPLARLE